MKYLWIFMLLTCLPAWLTNAQGTGELQLSKVLAEYTPSSLGKPVLLKINSWYLFASYPTSPYRSSDGTLMVPLRTLGELLGGSVRLDRQTQSGTLTTSSVLIPEGHLTIEFRNGSSTIILNQKTINAPAESRWIEKHNELLVPLKSLLGPLKIQVRVATEDFVHLVVETLSQNLALENFIEQQAQLGFRPTSQLLPKNIIARRAADLYSKQLFDVSLDLTTNASSKTDILSERPGLFLYVKYHNDRTDMGGPMSTEGSFMGPQNPDPCVQRQVSFKCQSYFFSGLLIDYVLGRVTLSRP